MKRLLLASAVALAAPLAAHADTYTLDPAHTEIGFTVKHMMVTNVHGKFDKFNGTVVLDEKTPSKSSVDFTADANSIDTGTDKRDAHLKSADFFDVAKYPTVTFKSTKVAKKGAGYTITGDLTMHGVTKPVTLTVTGITPEQKTPFGTTVRAASATGKLNRKDFGLTWNKALESGGVLVGDDVVLNIDTELIKDTKQAAK